MKYYHLANVMWLESVAIYNNPPNKDPKTWIFKDGRYKHIGQNQADSVELC